MSKFDGKVSLSALRGHCARAAFQALYFPASHPRRSFDTADTQKGMGKRRETDERERNPSPRAPMERSAPTERRKKSERRFFCGALVLSSPKTTAQLSPPCLCFSSTSPSFSYSLYACQLRLSLFFIVVPLFPFFTLFFCFFSPSFFHPKRADKLSILL